jgi:hypothetical protein
MYVQIVQEQRWRNSLERLVDICVCSWFLGEPIRQHKTSQNFYIFKHVLNINLVLIIRKCKIIISQTFESVRSNTQSLGSQLRLWNTVQYISYLCICNNRIRNDGWHHSEKVELALYLLGTSHNSEKNYNIETGLKYNIKFRFRGPIP